MTIRNTVSFAAATVALASVVSIAYAVLTGVLDGAVDLAAVLVAGEAVSLLALAGLLSLLGVCQVPLMPAGRRVLGHGTAIMAFVIASVGIAIAIATPYHLEGIAILLFPSILAQAAIIRAAIAGEMDVRGKGSIAEPQHRERSPLETIDLVTVLQQIAHDIVARTGSRACRLFTVSSDGGALVLRGEAVQGAVVSAAGFGRPQRVRLPVQELPWLERLLQRGDWLHVSSEIVGINGIGHELERGLMLGEEHGDLSLRTLCVAGSPVGVVCLVHAQGTSPATRARQENVCNVTIRAADAAIEQSLRLRSLGFRAGWWSTVMRELPYGLAVINRGTRLVAFNAAAEAALATSAEDILGRRLCDEPLSCTCPIHLTMRTGESRQVPLRSVWPFPVDQSTAGQPINIWAITDARDDPELVVLVLPVGGASMPRIGTEVAAMISHELRTPIATLRASSELALEEMNDPERQRGLLSTISRQVDRLDHLVEDLTDAFRLQSDKLQLRLEILDVPELCHELVCEFGDLATGHRIEVRAEEAVRAVAADRVRIRTVISNLVSNAIKYAPEDSEITITIVDTEDGLEVTVADQGPGITEEDMPHIFEQFYRSPSVASVTKGYGLGLYISRTLVESHGGCIRIENSDACGCRFTFTLPRHPDKSHAVQHQVG